MVLADGGGGFASMNSTRDARRGSGRNPHEANGQWVISIYLSWNHHYPQRWDFSIGGVIHLRPIRRSEESRRSIDFPSHYPQYAGALGCLNAFVTIMEPGRDEEDR